MKSLVGKILRKLLPFKYYKLVANGFIIVMYLPFVDVSLGAQNIFLAAETFGLSGTILSWAQKNIQENLQLRKLLSIPDDCIIVFCAVIGYPLYRYQIPTRKDIK